MRRLAGAAIVPGLGVGKPGEQGPDRQAVHIAGMDAGEQRLGNVGDRFRSEPAPHESGDRFVAVRSRARNHDLGGHPELGRRAEERGFEQRPEPRRKAENRSGRQRMQLAAAQNERGARQFGGEEAVAEADLVAECDGSRLLDEERVRPCVDDELANALRDDDATRPRIALEHDDRPFPLAQLEGGRQTGHSSADDGDVDTFGVVSHKSVVGSLQLPVPVSSRQSSFVRYADLIVDEQFINATRRLQVVTVDQVVD